MSFTVSDTLLQLELDLYKGQAEVLAKRVCELELRRHNLTGGIAGSTVQSRHARDYSPIHGKLQPLGAASEDQICRRIIDTPFILNDTEQRRREGLQEELDSSRQEIVEL
jgi:hypothetical protein